MKSIDFPQANIALAKDQPQYQTLFVHVGGQPEFEMTACFELSKEEVQEIVSTGKLWVTQVTFGRGFSPIRMTTQAPFESTEGLKVVPMDENRTPGNVWDKTHYFDYTGYNGRCENCGKEEQFHFWSSRQCEL